MHELLELGSARSHPVSRSAKKEAPPTPTRGVRHNEVPGLDMPVYVVEGEARSENSAGLRPVHRRLD
ncbi:hypothetical protein METHP14_920023 [Pseudomonas sp. P14-2025]